MPGQLGLEPIFTEYVSKLIEIFDQVKRVLKKEGSCWVNMGDTYNGEKSLCLIPQRFQIAMVDQGWICRNTIIWYKPNCMPSSAKDRFTVDFEYLFFFTKSQRYYFETQYEPLDSDLNSTRHIKKDNAYYAIGGNKYTGEGLQSGNPCLPTNPLGRIKRCVWKIPTAPFTQAHFAVFPPALVETPLKATCPTNGLVLDPFMGSGTVALVAMQNARNFLGIELSQEYIKMAMERLRPYLLQTRLV